MAVPLYAPRLRPLSSPGAGAVSHRTIAPPRRHRRGHPPRSDPRAQAEGLGSGLVALLAGTDTGKGAGMPHGSLRARGASPRTQRRGGAILGLPLH
jgi:hypothetical protein